MIKDLYWVYNALEEAARQCKDDPLFGAVNFPAQLEREPSLEQDMTFYFGPSWRELPECEPSEACRKYVARIREVVTEQPALLIAHTYTRYLGDLSGGQVLMRMA